MQKNLQVTDGLKDIDFRRANGIRIVFVLPSPIPFATGGYKMVYEYANRLVRLGANVRIVYFCAKTGIKEARKYHLPEVVRRLLVYAITVYRMRNCPCWFPLSKEVVQSCIYSSSAQIKDADAIIATAIKTVSYVSQQKSRVLAYFIQDYEAWGDVTEEEVQTSYRLGMRNIVITHWLERLVHAIAPKSPCICIPNGLDCSVFFQTQPIEGRGHHISMLYHRLPHKGSKYGVAAIKLLKKKYPGLRATLFGTSERPDNLPEWIVYIQNATQDQLRSIYNNSSVYIYPTIAEGFGLTCVEAMACGAALAVSDYEAAHEFAIQGETALLSPIRDVNALAANVTQYFEDEAMRCRIAKKGQRKAKTFNWDVSVEKFLHVLVE